MARIITGSTVMVLALERGEVHVAPPLAGVRNIALAPGDPALEIAGEIGGASPEVLAGIRAACGLNLPVPVQLGRCVLRAANGDRGYSFYFNQPVAQPILQHLPATALLMAMALLVMAANILTDLVHRWLDRASRRAVTASPSRQVAAHFLRSPIGVAGLLVLAPVVLGLCRGTVTAPAGAPISAGRSCRSAC